MDFADIDLLDRDRFTRGVPHDWFTFLRREAPVWRHPEPNGPGFWVISKHADVVAVGKDGQTFSSDQSLGGVVGLEEAFVEESYGELSAMMDPNETNLMLSMDAPRHTRYRRLVNRGFTPRMIGALEGHIRDLANEVIDTALAKERCDFVVDVAAEMTLQVIAEMLGVPREDRHKIFDWSNRLIGNDDPEYRSTSADVLEGSLGLFTYAQQLADDRRANPRDDIVSVLVSAEVDGDQLSDMDFNLFFLLLAVAGNETTRNAMAHGMLAFLQNPDQWKLLQEDPELHLDTAVEEILRWSSPVLYFRRNVTRDTEVRGVPMSAGDKVSIWYASANRDEEVFEDPFRFDIDRRPNDHVAFGGGGPHFCLGANLARMEIRILFEQLVTRVPDISAIGEIDLLRSNFIGGIKRLPVKIERSSVTV